MRLFISRFFPTALWGQSLVKNIGSLEAGAKLISITNSQVWKVLLDPCAGYRGCRGRLPQVAVSAEEQGWHKRRVWKRGFPARLRLPSPSAPEALFWAPWQEDSKWKEKKQTSVHVFLSSSNTFGSRIRMRNPYLVTFQAYSRRRTEGKKNMKTSTKGAILFLFCPCLLFI